MTALRFPPITTRTTSARPSLRFPVHHPSLIVHRPSSLPSARTTAGPTRDLFLWNLLHKTPNPSQHQDFRALRAVTTVRTCPIRVNPCPVCGKSSSQYAESRKRDTRSRTASDEGQGTDDGGLNLRLRRVLHRVIGRLLRDRNIVRVALRHARRGDAGEAGVLAEFLDVLRPAIPHPRAEAADHLVHEVRQRP